MNPDGAVVIRGPTDVIGDPMDRPSADGHSYPSGGVPKGVFVARGALRPREILRLKPCVRACVESRKIFRDLEGHRSRRNDAPYQKGFNPLDPTA